MAFAKSCSFSTRGLNVLELGKFLVDHGIEEETVQNFVRNKVCGDTFSKLTQEDLKELVPLIGNRVKVRELMQKVNS